MEKNKNIGILLGAIITIVGLLMFSHFNSLVFSRFESSTIPFIKFNTALRMKERKYDSYILGSSQCAQIQPKIINDTTGLKTLIACIPGGDISFIYSMARKISKETKNRPVIIAEYSPRYVSANIENFVYRDTLKFINAPNWMFSELPLLLKNSKYRKYYFNGIESSLIPCVRYKFSIKYLTDKNYSQLADFIMHPKTKTKKNYANNVHNDGHVGPYSLKQPAPTVPNKNSKPTKAISHKLNLWKKLYELHCSSNIFLILCKPAYHSSWNFHYNNKYDKKVKVLETFFRTNGVPIIDCTTINIEDSDCHDAHHFTWSGATKISELVGNQLAKILNKKTQKKVPLNLTSKKISELN